MKDVPPHAQADLARLSWTDWRERMHDLAGDDGYCLPLGADHAALFIEKKPTLLVTFETLDSVKATDPSGQPMAWPLVNALEWSHLALVSQRDTWFRDTHVTGFFDRLIDDGFFEEFEEVIFYGCGPAGYAACAYSVASPGAKVIALQPQATLDPRVTEWDSRYKGSRRVNFTDRFGYAPDMLDSATEAWIIYDPDVMFDAMHASLFNRDHITRVRARSMGTNLQATLIRMNVLYRALAQLSAGKLTALSMARLMRARRRDGGYLCALMLKLESQGAFRRMKAMCAAALKEQELRPIRRGLNRANRALGLKHNQGLGKAND
jgi:hypothetical protein